jgi:YceI-like domain
VDDPPRPVICQLFGPQFHGRQGTRTVREIHRRHRNRPEQHAAGGGANRYSVGDHGNDKRDEHLQAPGFFDSEHHPEALFASASILPVRGGYLLNGDLTIKGSKPVSLHLQYNGVGPDPRYRQVSRFTASITLDRKEFGVDYRLPLGLGDFIIGPTVTVGLDIVAAKNI